MSLAPSSPLNRQTTPISKEGLPVENSTLQALGRSLDVFDHLPDIVFFIKDVRGRYTLVNQALVERCGKKRKDEVIGRRVEELFPPLLAEQYRQQDDLVLKKQIEIVNQLELHLSNEGSKSWCLTNKKPIRDPRNGKTLGLIGISKDLPPSREKHVDYGQLAESIRHIQENYGEPLKIEDLAAMAGLSVYQYEQRMRRLFLITAGQFVHKTRIDAASRLLTETDHPISSVALEVGYFDQSAFSRQFKLTIGLTPGEFRRATRRTSVGP